MTKLYYETFKSPLGPMTIISTEEKVIRVDYGKVEYVKEKEKRWFTRFFPEAEILPGNKLTTEAKDQLKQYFASNKTTFSFPYELYGTPFQKSVWETVKKTVGYGEKCTYKDIGLRIDNVKAVRAIGGALNRNPLTIVVPCHRVVGIMDELVGYDGGVDKKAFLLSLEHLS